MRLLLRFRAPAPGEHLLPLPQDLPEQRVEELTLSHRPEAVYEARGTLWARFSLGEGEVLWARFRLRTRPVRHNPLWQETLLREPPEAWPGLLSERGHRVEQAWGFLLSGKPHAWLLVDEVPLDPYLFQALSENPALLLPLGVAPDPALYLGGHEGRRLLLLRNPWPGEAGLGWDELHPWGLDPLPWARGLAFASLGVSALGFPTGPWPYLPYLGLLAFRQGQALKGLFLRSPRHALESLFFHAFALSVTVGPKPELGLGYLALFLWNRLVPTRREGKPQGEA